MIKRTACNIQNILITGHKNTKTFSYYHLGRREIKISKISLKISIKIEKPEEKPSLGNNM